MDTQNFRYQSRLGTRCSQNNVSTDLLSLRLAWYVQRHALLNPYMNARRASARRCRNVRKYSFSQRTINVWNNLSTDCVHASSVNMFKNKIDKYLFKAGYT